MSFHLSLGTFYSAVELDQRVILLKLKQSNCKTFG